MSENTIAQGKCLICGGTAEIRRNVKKKLYFYCESSCGLVQATGNGAQVRIAAMIPAGEGAAAPVPAATLDDHPGLDNPTGQPAAPKKGLFQSILDAQVL